MIKEDMIRYAAKAIEYQKQIIEYYESRPMNYLDRDIRTRVIAAAKKEIEYHENVINLVIEGKLKA
uniref:Uncharacterized protein n=1 Tax=Ochrobactrum phage ORM_20 TaxID=2985243 RepID=A0A9N6ZGA1_9VIRU|nr:hypothetical protein ORM20_00111 [Ochrobactrum phage ORM_20]